MDPGRVHLKDHGGLCDGKTEIVHHCSAGYAKLSKGPYKRWHGKMDLRVYWELCEQYGVGCAKKWFEEIPNTARISKDLLSNQTTIDPMYLSSVGEILSGLLWNSLCLETRILLQRGRKY